MAHSRDDPPIPRLLASLRFRCATLIKQLSSHLGQPLRQRLWIGKPPRFPRLTPDSYAWQRLPAIYNLINLTRSKRTASLTMLGCPTSGTNIDQRLKLHANDILIERKDLKLASLNSLINLLHYSQSGVDTKTTLTVKGIQRLCH